MDLRLWKNTIKLKYSNQNIITFTPSCNFRENSDDDINLAGTRMANELLRWIRDEAPQKELKKISFIAHSMGGLVVRAALPHLERYKDVMYSFMSLGSPHLGYLIKTKGLVNSGILKSLIIGFWLIRRYHKSVSLS